MDELIVSVSGLRGIVGTSLTPEVAVRYAEAFLATLPPGGIVIGRDGRASGGMFADAIAAAVMAAGREVLDAGVAATPTVGVLVEEHQAAGGIQISASHNPPQYNGMKLFSAAGWVLTAEAGRVVLARFHEPIPLPTAETWQSMPRCWAMAAVMPLVEQLTTIGPGVFSNTASTASGSVASSPMKRPSAVAIASRSASGS
jgi:phosphomannomutase